MKEIETKILEFNDKELRNALKGVNAEYLGKVFQKRVVFFVKSEIPGQDEFVRVRTNGKTTTLTYKFRRKSESLDNTEEIEIEASDFGKTVSIVSKIWKGDKPFYQENIAERWAYKGVEIAILTWPLIPPYIELEGETEQDVRKVIKELRIKGEEIGNTNLVKIFERYGQTGKDSEDLRF